MSDTDFSKIAQAASREAFSSDNEDEVPELIGIVDDEDEARSLYIYLLRSKITSLGLLQEQRTKYASRLFWLISVWLAGVFFILFTSGLTYFEIDHRLFALKISDTVLVTYLTTTTVTVIGLFIIVANWLFPKQENGDKKKKTA